MADTSWPERPNILSISFEDCTPWFGCYGHPVRTPNVDRLAAEGAMWPNAFTPAPVCSPTRSAVMTGMHPVSLGTHHMRTITYRDQGLDGYEAVIPHYVRCYPEYLRAAGYWCCNDGKHDYQFAAPVTVWDQTSNPWFEDGTAHWRNRPDPDQPFLAQFNLGDSHESQSWENSKFDDAHLADHGIDPADVIVPPYFPDTPKVRRSIARVYASIEHNDRIVGRLLDELEEDGLTDSTAVFIWTDHGPLPRGKRWPYDSGIHSPMIVRWPGVLDPGTVRDELLSVMDLGPTFLSMCGVTVPPHLHGKPFLGAAAGDEVGHDYVFAARDRFDQHYDMVRASRDTRWKYIRHSLPNQPYVGWVSYRNHHPIMEELWRLHVADELDDTQAAFMASTRPIEELYDTEADPHEIHNVADDPANREVLDRHRAAVDAWQTEVGDLGFVTENVMIDMMWPGRVQPDTNPPQFVVYSETETGRKASNDGGTFPGPVLLQLHCDTQGASIGWTTESSPADRGHESDGGETDDETAPRWMVYHEPLRLEPGATVTVRALAHRIGYAPSDEIAATFTIT